jgi:hypothetical protein
MGIQAPEHEQKLIFGDNGAGLGASHQTGWTGLIARSLDLFARLTPERVMETPKTAIAGMTREQVAGQKA